jgi:LacI family gluconate utilization system Gnt-I transcriptional repressor
VGFIKADDARAKRREQSTWEALEEYGITDIQSTTVPVPSSMELGRVGTRRLLEEGLSNGVIFCSSDTLAQGVLAELLYRNIRIPDDIAVIGFGDQVFAAHTYPPLTTVRIDRERIGREAVDALLARINGQQVKKHIIDVGFTIVARSTA